MLERKAQQLKFVGIFEGRCEGESEINFTFNLAPATQSLDTKL